ncbi:unnamed protein product [Blepharisma stoltei]|uniref:Uncharacterized protein n=1 Tax=Blepharisma stoltei TaxID=1481888 RepID=A0AAU9JJA8_9CILI|nr:unnamed protein product [Blepharisma stoltei]
MLTCWELWIQVMIILCTVDHWLRQTVKKMSYGIFLKLSKEWALSRWIILMIHGMEAQRLKMETWDLFNREMEELFGILIPLDTAYHQFFYSLL